jgi:hypothetical protein
MVLPISASQVVRITDVSHWVFCVQWRKGPVIDGRYFWSSKEPENLTAASLSFSAKGMRP